MNYSEFKMYLTSSIADRIGEDTKVCIRKIPKNNGVEFDGITIYHTRRNVAPTIYLEWYWQRYLEGEDVDTIAEMIITENEKYSIDKNLDVEDFLNFDRIRDKVMYKLINYEMNRDFLETVPMRKMLDLAVVYYYRIDDDELTGATCAIRNEDIERWKITEEDLWKLASVNTPREEPAKIRGLCECLFDYYSQSFGDGSDELYQLEDMMYRAGMAPMHILSNKSQIFGAACILYPDAMKDLSKEFGTDLFVIPSSIHEVILMPASDDYDYDDLSMMVRDVNESDVLPHEILSDHVYRYYADREVIRL